MSYQGSEQQWIELGTETRGVYKAVVHLLENSGGIMTKEDRVELEKTYQSMLKFKGNAENVMLKPRLDMDKAKAFEVFYG